MGIILLLSSLRWVQYCPFITHLIITQFEYNTVIVIFASQGNLIHFVSYSQGTKWTQYPLLAKMCHSVSPKSIHHGIAEHSGLVGTW